jgi:ribosomal protein S12 methylthiotransferase
MTNEQRTVSLITLGCARNETDSEELAARLQQAGWRIADPNADPADSDIALVNTCGFIEAAKQESVRTILTAAATGTKVIATGCMAERYGHELAQALPEAGAVLSFDDYPDIETRLEDVLKGRAVQSHQPRDRRKLLPITPVDRTSQTHAHIPGHRGPASGPRPMRHRLGGSAAAPLKLASGCDRRCTFCAIPSFRGSFVSRPADELLAEAEWLANHGVRELQLVSENSTSYGKDLGNLRALDELLPQLAAIVDQVRVHYLQPAELRPSLIETIAGTSGVAQYFDLSFQHASGPVLRRMRRFGDRQRFLDLIQRIRDLAPDAGIRSNFIVGFPGETDHDFDEVERFIIEARLDAIGVFGYSDEDGTEAASLPDKIPPTLIKERSDQLRATAYEVMAQRAAARVGQTVTVIMATTRVGWAAHQAPDIDGTVTLPDKLLHSGDLCQVVIVGADGPNLTGQPVAEAAIRA